MRSPAGDAGVDTTVSVGSVTLANPVMTASGTAGHGTELAGTIDVAALGAIVVKSLSADPWKGNPAPRVVGTAAGMVNSIGLQGPGVAAWLRDDLPALVATGATVVASIWGRSVQDYRRAADALAPAAADLAAVEVNVSCPNVEDRGRIFANFPELTAEVVAACEGAGLPRWVKLGVTASDLVGVASAAVEAGAEALTLINTVPGMVIDTETRSPHLGGGGGGLSGRAIHPVAVRAVYDCRAALPDVAIVGVGGVDRGVDAVELMMAGAHAVQVGTASFAGPRAPLRILAEMTRWCATRDVQRLRSLTSTAHDRSGT